MSKKLSFIKLDPKVTLPSYATTGSAGLDVKFFSQDGRQVICIEPGETAVLTTGLRSVFSNEYELQVRTRSGLAMKQGLVVLNSPGTIDSDYDGEIKILLHNASGGRKFVNDGDRIAQLVLSKVEIEESLLPQQLTIRDGGFGSTGIN